MPSASGGRRAAQQGPVTVSEKRHMSPPPWHTLRQARDLPNGYTVVRDAGFGDVLPPKRNLCFVFLVKSTARRNALVCALTNVAYSVALWGISEWYIVTICESS
jgi:hypothetical protein